ncbi:MAG: ATP synthase subunit I [Sandaracinaceae bacterium]|jgi:hypothetical protein|nr:ATP synthase subunit I [Sandaracinaceae bacterium]
MNALLRTTTKTTLGFAAVLVVLSFAAIGVPTGIGALVGSAVAVANWFLLRISLSKLVDARVEQRAGITLLLCLKLGLTGVVAFIAIRRLHVDPLGFMIGFGALVLGILTASILFSAETASAQPAADAPGEEI